MKKALERRRAVRRGRRQRKTRYRKLRFDNRARPNGWLTPSLENRVANVLTWVKRLRRVRPVKAMGLELVTFDLQQMENPDISGVHYQQWTLFGYEIRYDLLEKWDRACRSCGGKQMPLHVEHIQARAKGGQIGSVIWLLRVTPAIKPKGHRMFEYFWLENLICLHGFWLRQRLRSQMLLQ